MLSGKCQASIPCIAVWPQKTAARNLERVFSFFANIRIKNNCGRGLGSGVWGHLFRIIPDPRSQIPDPRSDLIFWNERTWHFMLCSAWKKEVNSKRKPTTEISCTPSADYQYLKEHFTIVNHAVNFPHSCDGLRRGIALWCIQKSSCTGHVQELLTDGSNRSRYARPAASTRILWSVRIRWWNWRENLQEMEGKWGKFGFFRVDRQHFFSAF